jgi:hypothetical protein
MKIRLFALVGDTSDLQRVKHLQGLPPEFTQGEDYREALPLARVVVLEGKEGSVTLNRFTTGGIPVSDTWHQTVEDAKFQADYEYGDALGEWNSVPSEVSDAVDYALAAAS